MSIGFLWNEYGVRSYGEIRSLLIGYSKDVHYTQVSNVTILLPDNSNTKIKNLSLPQNKTEKDK